jgi:hypothetical protein
MSATVTADTVFNVSLQHMSFAENFKRELFNRAIQTVGTWNNNEEWKLSRDIRMLAKQLFDEYSRELRSRFDSQEYHFWLERIIKADESIFIPELRTVLEKKLGIN